MTIKDFYELVELEKEPKAEMFLELQLLTKKYPFFQAGLYTYIKCLYLSGSDNYDTELDRLIPFIMDRKALFYYVMRAEYAKFEKQTGRILPPSRTEALISAFFETLDDSDMQRELEHAIVNSSMASLDYFSYLESSESTPSHTPTSVEGIPSFSMDDVDLHGQNKGGQEDPAQMKHQDIIDNFISKSGDSDTWKISLDTLVDENLHDVQADSQPAPSGDEQDDDFFFTQTLANIYIKQKKYDRAYEIIKRLNLNYPEKNIYFADQLIFLEKVIKNLNKK